MLANHFTYHAHQELNLFSCGACTQWLRCSWKFLAASLISDSRAPRLLGLILVHVAVLGIELTALCLQSKHFSHWTIPCPPQTLLKSLTLLSLQFYSFCFGTTPDTGVLVFAPDSVLCGCSRCAWGLSCARHQTSGTGMQSRHSTPLSYLPIPVTLNFISCLI